MDEQCKVNNNFKTSWKSAIESSRFKAIMCSKFQEMKERLLLADDLLSRDPSAPDEVIRTLLDNGTISESYTSEIAAGSDQPASGLFSYAVKTVSRLMGSNTSSDSRKSHGKAKQSRHSPPPPDDKQFIAKANDIGSRPILTEAVVDTLKLAQDYLQQQVEEATDSLKTQFIRELKSQLHKQNEKEVKSFIAKEDTMNSKDFLLAAAPTLSKLEENANQWVYSVEPFERKN
jgi:hypothetical protein